MEMKWWNVPRLISLIAVAVVVAVSDDDIAAEAEAVGGGTEDNTEPLDREYKYNNKYDNDLVRS